MECDAADIGASLHEKPDVRINDSTEDFQNFVYDLFEKNGILNDLRAYLRGHIVGVLRKAHTDEPLACQKHFTQRLELQFQAINILLVEYLLQLEFSYSLSVFISEIPLANMVFALAKTLLSIEKDVDKSSLRFKDSDVWAVLNYLGVECDSDNACKIMEMYKSEHSTPLLLCIMKCMSLVQREPVADKDETSVDSLSLSQQSSSDSTDEKKHRKTSNDERCRHHSACKACQRRMRTVRHKYRRKKKQMDQMFQQLKSVYEGELEMVRTEEQSRVKRTVASHLARIKQSRDQMEASYRAKETELNRNITHKKKFLWQLARSLRSQHAHVTRAMRAVTDQSSRLDDREENLKTQLAEADAMLRKRGEEMKEKITGELAILEGHLKSMKKERSQISHERAQLENMKCKLENKATKVYKENNDDLRSHYDLLQNELTLLKKYIASSKLEPKCVIERGTITDLNDLTAKLNITLNNEQISYDEKTNVARIANNKVVNDLKKHKNVNFSAPTTASNHNFTRFRSSGSSEAGDTVTPRSVERLQGDNERLQDLARQQSQHIDQLTTHQSRLQDELFAARRTIDSHTARERPATAPSTIERQPEPFHITLQRLSGRTSASNFNSFKGAGEQLSAFNDVRPRIVLPGDTVPFLGVVGERTHDGRRHLIKQWRALRQTTLPSDCDAAKEREPLPTDIDSNEHAAPEDHTDISHLKCDIAKPEPLANTSKRSHHRHKSPPKFPSNDRDKSPKSVLKEAKEKLKINDTCHHAPRARSASPNATAVLREAKLRLRKLEIEAAAVEQSYLDFRRRQTLPTDEEHAERVAPDGGIEFGKHQDKNILEFEQKTKAEVSFRTDQQAMKRDFDKFFKQYQSKYNFSDTHSDNSNSAAHIVKPIPKEYADVSKIKKDVKDFTNDNYIEKPLTEFRKLYHSEVAKRPAMHRKSKDTIKSTPEKAHQIDVKDIPETSDNSEPKINSRRELIKKVKNDKEAELIILKDNLNKLYNVHKDLTNSNKTIDNSELQSGNHMQDKKFEDAIIEYEKNYKDITQVTVKHSYEISKAADDSSLIKDYVEVETEETNVEMPQVNMNRNLLCVEIENVQINNVRMADSNTDNDVLLVVESSIDERALDLSKTNMVNPPISTAMTILISPKINSRDSKEEMNKANSESHQSRELLKSDNHMDLSKLNKSQTPDEDIPENDTEVLRSEENDGLEDYPDDFSADVDNYDSNHGLDDQFASPTLSLPKTSEDENFWES